MPIDAAAIADQLLLGRYRVLEERGKGGFGTVNVCWDPRLMRRVAIKTIRLHMAEPAAKPAPRKRAHDVPMAGTPAPAASTAFPGAPGYQPVPPYQPDPDPEATERRMLLRAALAETRTASMLAHPSIVSMLDFESDDENAYIIMEYVEGASLAELLDSSEDGLLTADEAAAVVDAVCDALQFAHDNGVLHLDIKPDNILVDMSGRVKLADFGMAALSSVTGYAGARGGTVGYMPPEQIACEHVDVRTDIFAFASVMYEALTGVRPFAAANLADSRALVERGAADPCALNEDVSPQAADALLVALNPDPAVRPTSAEAFANDLLAGLGRPKAGRKSLAAFVAETLDDSQPAQEPASPYDVGENPSDTDAYPQDPDLGPLECRYPGLATWLLRALAAACPAIVALLALQALMGGAASVLVCAAILLVVGGLGVVAPQAGSALALAVLVAACVAAGAWPMGVALLVIGAAWWMLAGRTHPLGSSGALAGALAGGTLPLGPLLCGCLLPAGRAALSAAFGFAVCTALACLAAASDPAGAAQAGQAGAACAELVSSASFWLAGAGWAGAAAAMGALCHGGSKTRCYLGCLLSGVVLLVFELVSARVENGGSWFALAPEVAAYTAGSTILMAIFVFMFGAARSLDVDGAQAQSDNDSAREGTQL